jgi:hypothetical protein
MVRNEKKWKRLLSQTNEKEGITIKLKEEQVWKESSLV